MRHFKTAALFILFVTGLTFSQKIYFCQEIDYNGRPVGAYNVFYSSSTSGYLYVLVRSSEEMSTSKVKFKFYSVDEYGYETYLNTLYENYDDDYTWFGKQFSFHSTGNYKVYVYDDDDELLTTGTVTIIFV